MPVRSQSSETQISVPGAKIDITLPDQQMKLSQQDLLNWIKNSAETVAGYYGRFPVPHLTLKVRGGSGSGIRHGVTYPKDGGLIFVSVGDTSDVDDLRNDWVLVHEMIHLAFPSMADNHHWIEEGISTYVEAVARAQSGNLTPADVWKEFMRDMPKGQPASGDQGLDHTPTWGRTYWGGAAFCMVADVQMRERTHNRKGLQDALRAIKDHGTISDDWEIEKALSIGDKATGTTVLMDLYKKMAGQPSPVDLDQLWQKLGIALQDGKVVFNDKAPEAQIRQAITEKHR